MYKKEFAILQILLVLAGIFALFYFVEANVNYQFQNVSLDVLSLFDSIIFNSHSLVSADTCPVDNNGAICQEYATDQCNSLCKTSCLPQTPSETSICQVGTCYDPTQGNCQVGSTQEACQLDEGQWFSDPAGNVAQCKQGCCTLGSSTFFGTSQQCSEQSNVTGLVSSFNPQITDELTCLNEQQNQVQGACVERKS